jgi:hypothetical protein
MPWVHNEKKPLQILKKERLTAGDMLQVRKVAKHVYEKLFCQDIQDKDYDEDHLTEIANKTIEIVCIDRALDPNLDLRTVKFMIWKKFSTIELLYRRRKNEE